MISTSLCFIGQYPQQTLKIHYLFFKSHLYVLLKMSGQKVGVASILVFLLVMIGVLVSLLFLSSPNSFHGNSLNATKLPTIDQTTTPTKKTTKGENIFSEDTSTMKYSTSYTKENNNLDKSDTTQSTFKPLKPTQHLNKGKYHPVKNIIII